MEPTEAQQAAAETIEAVAPRAEQERPDLEDTSLYFNRELSWLDFNDRVLQLAEDSSVPLLERVKFSAIWESNLDEFFMVRVANLHDQVEDGIRITNIDGADQDELLELERLFQQQVFPVLTPLVIGRGRPFPYISNLSLSLVVVLHDPEQDNQILARVKVPKELLGRFLQIGKAQTTLVPLDDLIAANLASLFPGMEVVDHALFRVTRDTDYDVSDEADDLMQAVEEELRRRRFGEVVRLEVDQAMSARLREQLRDALRIDRRQLYETEGLL